VVNRTRLCDQKKALNAILATCSYTSSCLPHPHRVHKKWPFTRHVSYICKHFDEKVLHTSQNNTYTKDSVKRTSGRHFNLPTPTVVYEISKIAGTCYSYQASFFNKCAIAVWFTLYLSVYKSTLFFITMKHCQLQEVQKYFKTLCTLIGCIRH